MLQKIEKHKSRATTTTKKLEALQIYLQNDFKWVCLVTAAHTTHCNALSAAQFSIFLFYFALRKFCVAIAVHAAQRDDVGRRREMSFT